MEHIEEREQERNRLLSWLLGGFTAWWGLTVAGSLMDDWGGGSASILPLFLSVLGGTGLVYAAYRLWQFQGEIRAEPQVARALDDELSRQIRLESYACAFWTLIAAAGLHLVLSGLFPSIVGDLLSGRSMAGLVVLVGVDSALISYLLRSREAARV